MYIHKEIDKEMAPVMSKITVITDVDIHKEMTTTTVMAKTADMEKTAVMTAEVVVTGMIEVTTWKVTDGGQSHELEDTRRYV